MQTMTTLNHRSATPTETRGRRRGRAPVVVAAVAAAVAVWLVARVAGVDLTVDRNSGGDAVNVGLGMVAIASALAGLAGWGLLAVLERVTSRARTIWTNVALCVLVVSLAAPIGAGSNVGTKLALAGTHLAVAAVLIPRLRRTVEPTRR